MTPETEIAKGFYTASARSGRSLSRRNPPPRTRWDRTTCAVVGSDAAGEHAKLTTLADDGKQEAQALAVHARALHARGVG
jgi:hypothetical protein